MSIGKNGHEHAMEQFVLSDGEADGESDDDDDSEPEDWNANEFWYGRDDDDSGDRLYDVRTYGSPPDSDGGWETSSSVEYFNNMILWREAISPRGAFAGGGLCLQILGSTSAVSLR